MQQLAHVPRVATRSFACFVHSFQLNLLSENYATLEAVNLWRKVSSRILRKHFSGCAHAFRVGQDSFCSLSDDCYDHLKLMNHIVNYDTTY